MRHNRWFSAAAWAIGALVCMSALAGCAGSSSVTSTVNPNASVIAVNAESGSLLRDLDGLISHTFGSGPVCVTPTNGTLNFVGGDCVPLSEHALYTRTFQVASQGSLAVERRPAPRMHFGNYDDAVLIRGHLVACGSSHGYLVRLASQVSFTLECVRPLG
jgi:hypothetical protein